MGCLSCVVLLLVLTVLSAVEYIGILFVHCIDFCICFFVLSVMLTVILLRRELILFFTGHSAIDFFFIVFIINTGLQGITLREHRAAGNNAEGTQGYREQR